MTSRFGSRASTPSTHQLETSGDCPKNVVISVFDHPRYNGGGQMIVHAVADHLAEDFHVTVLTTARRRETTIKGRVHYHKLPVGWAGPRGGQLLFHLLLPFTVRRLNHDLWIESFTPPFSTSFLPLFSNSTVVGLAQSLSGKEMWERYRLPFFLIERLGLRLYRNIVVLNPAHRVDILKYSPRSSISVIPNGILGQKIDKGSIGEGHHILYLGRVDIREKGLDLLIQAYVRSQVAMPLLLAGAGTPREERRLASLVDTAKGDIRWLGHVSGAHKQALLRESAFLVMPSRQETFGLVALEGMSFGKPILHFDLPALRWMDGDVRVPPFDVNALADAMCELTGDADARRKLGMSAHAATAQYSDENMSAGYRALAGRLLATDAKAEPE